MAFYRYSQNNSFGVFEYDEQNGISVSVLVEADNAPAANERAESIGLYFYGNDCECCGSRWEMVSEDSWYKVDASEVPEPGAKFKKGRAIKWMEHGKPEMFVHLADGSFYGTNL